MDKSKLAVSTYNKIAKDYDQQYFDDISNNPLLDLFIEKLPRGAKVLDAGCGPGQNSAYMRKKGINVTGIDLSQEMLTIARNKVSGIDFLEMDLRHLDFEEKAFDGILAAYSLIHIPMEELPETLKGLHRILKPGGILAVIAQTGKPDQIVPEPFLPNENMFFNFFSKPGLRSLLVKAGFKVNTLVEHSAQDQDTMSQSILFALAQR